MSFSKGECPLGPLSWVISLKELLRANQYNKWDCPKIMSRFGLNFWKKSEFYKLILIWRFSASLVHVVKALLKINYDYVGKVSARIVEVKFKPGLGKPGSHLTGLKISHVIVFSPGEIIISMHFLLDFQPGLKFSLYIIISAWAEILHVIANNSHPGYVDWDFSPSWNSS